jgi:hypothetical protein
MAKAGKQMPQLLDLTHHGSIGGGFLAGDGSGEAAAAEPLRLELR